MEWRVVGETVGMVTLPTEVPEIRIGTVTVRLKDLSFASEEPYQTLIPLSGHLVPTQQRPALIPIEAETFVEADDSHKAMDEGHAVIETALDFLFLAMGSPIAPLNITLVISTGSNRRFHFIRQATAQKAKVQVWNSNQVDRVLSTLDHIEALSSTDFQHLRNVFRWWRKAGTSHEVDIQYLFCWFAIEALSQMSFVEVKPKKRQCVKCQRTVKCDCGAEQTYLPEVRVLQLLVDTAGVISKRECRRLYDLRSRVAHGSISVLPDEEKVLAEAIPVLNEALRVVALRVVNGEYRSR